MYWLVEYEEKPDKEETKTFLVVSPIKLGALFRANRFIGPGECTIVPLTIEHLIKKFKFYNGVSVYND